MKKISSKDAPAEFHRRFGYRWELAAYLGWLFATSVEVAQRAIHRADEARREANRHRSRKPLPAIPAWLREGIRVFGPFLRAHPTGPAGGMVAMGDRLMPYLDSSQLKPDDLVSLDAPTVEAAAQRVHDPAARPALHSFYVGVEIVWRARHGVDPTASTVALLAAACALEEFDRLTHARRRWETRIRRWKDAPGLDVERERFEAIPNSAWDAIVTHLLSMPRAQGAAGKTPHVRG